MKAITVIGGGVTGLAAAYFLQQSMPGTSISLVESSKRLGGKLLTNRIGNAAAEAGPDSIVARNSVITRLCSDLGLEQSLIRPKTSKSYLWTRNRLRPIPEGVFGGYPSHGLLPLWRTHVLSFPGIARTAMDLVLPRTEVAEDISIGKLAESRFGREFKTTLVDPLIGGLMSCNSSYLSARELMPGLFSLAKTSRSVLRASRARASVAESMPFFSFRGGVAELTDKLNAATGKVQKKTGVEVKEMSRREGRWHITGEGLEIESDAVIACLPAHAAAPVLKSEAALSSALAEIRYTSVANVVFGYGSADFKPPVEGSGFLVPEKEGLLMTGCTWLSSKWSSAEAEGLYLVRCFVGTPDSVSWMDMGDEELVSELHRELGAIMKINGKPLQFIVTRWQNGLPRYGVGHMELVSKIHSLCPPGLFLAGAAFSGIGISSCVADAKRAADSAAAYCSAGS